MTREQEAAPRRGREGGRWINQRPTSEEFATWFRESMKIDPALNVEDYVGGVVLIPAVDSRAPTVVGFRDGAPLIEKREELSFVPYAKVETRINYFWDLVEAHKDDWVAVVERHTPPRLSIADPAAELLESLSAVEGMTPELADALLSRVQRPGALAQMVHQLPEGFSLATVPVGEAYTYFLCCTMRVAIYDREEWRATPLHERADLAALREGIGTKQVPLLKRGYNNSGSYADDSSLMKAETGALGRALGFAGIFVIPGSGVATAEDMADVTQGPTVAESEPAQSGPTTPTEAPVKTGVEQAQDDERGLRERAAALFRQLSENHPAKTDEFGKWAKQRRLVSLGDAKGAMLVGVVRKLEKLIDEAEAAEPEGKEESAVPAVASPEPSAGDA